MTARERIQTVRNAVGFAAENLHAIAHADLQFQLEWMLAELDAVLAEPTE